MKEGIFERRTSQPCNTRQHHFLSAEEGSLRATIHVQADKQARADSCGPSEDR